MMLDRKTFRQIRDSLEVRLDVMLRATEPRFKSCDKRILADLNQAGCPQALFVNDRGAARNQRFFRNAIQVTAAAFDVGACFV